MAFSMLYIFGFQTIRGQLSYLCSSSTEQKQCILSHKPSKSVYMGQSVHKTQLQPITSYAFGQEPDLLKQVSIAVPHPAGNISQFPLFCIVTSMFSLLSVSHYRNSLNSFVVTAKKSHEKSLQQQLMETKNCQRLLLFSTFSKNMKLFSCSWYLIKRCAREEDNMTYNIGEVQGQVLKSLTQTSSAE